MFMEYFNAGSCRQYLIKPKEVLEIPETSFSLESAFPIKI